METNKEVFRIHFNEIIDEYTRVLIINLIDKKGDQKILGDYYQNLSKQNKTDLNLDFIWFDFHKECKNIESLTKLLILPTIKDDFENFDHTHIVVPNTFIFNNYHLENVNNINFISCQTGVFRVNCVDCLDRTNVVQTFFAKEIMKILFKKIYNIQDEYFETHFYSVFNNIWADNGDQLALSYSGTKAMKSDYIRKGKSSISGSLKDGYYSVKRYFLNNFSDGYNQDCIEYSLGKIPLRNINFKDHSSTFSKSIAMFIIMFTIILYYYILLILTDEIKSNEDNSKKFIRILIFFLLLTFNSKIILKNLKEKMIDKPSNKHIFKD